MNQGVFLYDDASHKYTLDGRNLTSVTQALKGAGLVEYDSIPASVLERARLRGTAVHAACHYLDDGDSLDWTTVDPEIVGYIRAWENFKKETGVEILAMETPMYHPVYFYSGTPDRDIRLNGRRGVLDLKTYEVKDWTGIQLAGYEMMMRGKDAPLDRWGLWLKQDGKYRLTPFKDYNDEKVFLSCLTITNWKLNHNGGKP